jgi:uncharacterized protein YndB with AHSA1/START domain
METENRIQEKELVITRTLDAPRELVFKVWTDPEHLKNWFGPKGYTAPVFKMDFRVGGVYHYCLKGQDGQIMWGKWIYKEIIVPEKITLIQSFSDENGKITRHPMSKTWPLQTKSTTTFEEKDGKTILTLRWIPYEATEEEIKTFNDAHPGMNQGWSGTFEQLETYLKSL